MSSADPGASGHPGPALMGIPDEAELTRLAHLLFSQPPRAPQSPFPGPPLSGPGLTAPGFRVDRQRHDDASAPRALSPGAIAIPDPLPSLEGGIRRFPVAMEVPSFMVDHGEHQPVPASPDVSLPQTAPASALDPSSLHLPADGYGAARPLNPGDLRGDFPILQERIHRRPLVWLDNGATTQKPRAVIERLERFYRRENSNIHRAAHERAARATDAYERARAGCARFLHAASSEEIVFARGTTEAINLVAQSWGRCHLEEGDEIVLTHLEHHTNIVPWQQLALEKGVRLRVAPVDEGGQVILEAYERLFHSRTKLAALTQVSNALGTVPPVEEMVRIAHRHGALVLLDGAQGVAHMPVDVQALDVDFDVFSGHKIYGPTGIGVLYGKRQLLQSMSPWQGGGNMIRDVTFERTQYQDPPHRFEAGTGSIADAVGLATALDYVERIGMHAIERAEQDLLAYATPLLLGIGGLRLSGCAAHKAGVLSFVMDGLRPEAVGSALNQEGIAVRAGHHCAQPILRRFGVESTVRATLALYNTQADVDALVAALRRLRA